MHDLSKQLIDKILIEKQKIITDRLLSLGIEFNPDIEKIKRFKSFSIERLGDNETIYFNDGSIEGLRIITFITKQIPFDHKKMTIEFETKYY